MAGGWWKAARENERDKGWRRKGGRVSVCEKEIDRKRGVGGTE